MSAVAIGPLMLAGDRLAVVAGMLVFLLLAGTFASRVDPRIGIWCGWALIVGLLVARMAHVALHWSSFAVEPLRAFAFWDGGFFWPAGVAAAMAVAWPLLAGARARLWAAGSLAAGVLVAVSGLQFATVESIASPHVFLPVLDGGELALSEGAGPTVVNLWASWCPPCRREMPMMAAVAATTTGVRFVFANQAEDRAAIREYLDEAGISLPIVLLDSNAVIAKHYGVPGLPATLFIGSDGVLADVHLGEISRAVFDAKLAMLEGDGGAAP